jgi:hypothetical protein
VILLDTGKLQTARVAAGIVACAVAVTDGGCGEKEGEGAANSNVLRQQVNSNQLRDALRLVLSRSISCSREQPAQLRLQGSNRC